MKILVSVLLLVFGVTTCFAQSSTPDYIQKAKVGLNQYYPQFKDYFEPIFGRIMGLKENSRNLINSKIHDNFDTFSDEITTEKDKCATALLVFEGLARKEQFRKSSIFLASDEDIRLGIANEIVFDVNVQVKKEIAKLDAKNLKLRELTNLVLQSNKNRESTENISRNIEDFFVLCEVSEIKDNSGLHKIIKEYINLNKQINRHPNAIGQKFIDEYNRITRYTH